MWHIDHLPRNSLYAEAMGTDEELAAEMARQESELGEDDPTGPMRPKISEFDAHADLLTAVVNELRMLKATVIGAASGSNPKVDLLRGPEYALEKMRLVERERAHYALAARLTPHNYPDGPPK